MYILLINCSDQLITDQLNDVYWPGVVFLTLLTSYCVHSKVESQINVNVDILFNSIVLIFYYIDIQNSTKPTSMRGCKLQAADQRSE